MSTINDMTVTQLREILREAGVPGVSRMRKADLVDLISESADVEDTLFGPRAIRQEAMGSLFDGTDDLPDARAIGPDPRGRMLEEMYYEAELERGARRGGQLRQPVTGVPTYDRPMPSPDVPESPRTPVPSGTARAGRGLLGRAGGAALKGLAGLGVALAGKEIWDRSTNLLAGGDPLEEFTQDEMLEMGSVPAYAMAAGGARFDMEQGVRGLEARASVAKAMQELDGIIGNRRDVVAQAAAGERHSSAVQTLANMGLL